jgi:hypothetical protein
MASYDFSELESRFPEIVQKMPDTFDSHEFILALAQQNQDEYVKALCDYTGYLFRGKPAPFQAVHRVIIQKLAKHSELVSLIRDDKPSRDIFGKSHHCGEWQKVR